MSKTRLPNVRSFLLADAVFQQKSGKWCIIGVFGKIRAREFPTVQHTMGIYVQLSDAEGDYEVKLELRSAEEKVLAALEGIKLRVDSRLTQVDFGFQAYRLPIPEAGAYHFRMYFNGVPAIEDLVFEAEQLPAAPPQAQG